jgi:hypothetical protein
MVHGTVNKSRDKTNYHKVYFQLGNGVMTKPLATRWVGSRRSWLGLTERWNRSWHDEIISWA